MVNLLLLILLVLIISALFKSIDNFLSTWRSSIGFIPTFCALVWIVVFSCLVGHLVAVPFFTENLLFLVSICFPLAPIAFVH